MKLSFFIKINAYLILLILFFNKKSRDLKLFIKLEGDELEEIILKFFKISLTHRYISNRVLLCLHYLFIKVLVSEEIEETEVSTCRKIEKKDRFLTKKNLDNFFKPEFPKLFYDYEKSNQFIEKFYRRNLLKKDKGEIERVVIVNILKILLSTIDNNNSTSNQVEYTKDYIPEILLKYYYVDQGNRMTFTVENTNENFIVAHLDEWALRLVEHQVFIMLMDHVLSSDIYKFFLVEEECCHVLRAAHCPHQLLRVEVEFFGKLYT